MADYDERTPAEDIEADRPLGETIDRFLSALVRRRWVVLSCLCTGVAAGIGIAYLLPERFTSEATLFALEQRVPERFVVPVATTDPSQALEALVQDVLSRPRLLELVNTVGLYKNSKEPIDPEQLLGLVRRDLSIEPVERMLSRGNVNAFRIAFTADTPALAQASTRQVTTLFIERNVRVRTEQAKSTADFLREQSEAAKATLLEQEEKLREFRMRYLGELPQQEQSNMSVLGSLQNQLDNVLTMENQAKQQRLYLESLLGEYSRTGRARSTSESAGANNETPLEYAERELERLKAARSKLLAVYKAKHPEVMKIEAEVAAQQAVVDSEKRSVQSAPKRAPASVVDSAPREQQMVIAQLRSQLQVNALERENLVAKEQKLRDNIEAYQSRLNMTPVREQQLTAMQRDYDLVKQHYGELLKKEQESRLATDLETRQEGQQFQLADPPSLPIKPSTPKRTKISMIGFAGGLLAGCALAFLLEFRQTVVRSEEAAKKEFQLPFVVSIPKIVSQSEKRRLIWRKTFEWALATVLISAVTFAELYVFRNG